MLLVYNGYIKFRQKQKPIYYYLILLDKLVMYTKVTEVSL